MGRVAYGVCIVIYYHGFDKIIEQGGWAVVCGDSLKIVLASKSVSDLELNHDKNHDQKISCYCLFKVTHSLNSMYFQITCGEHSLKDSDPHEVTMTVTQVRQVTFGENSL